MTNDRVIAADLYRALEGMLFLALNPNLSDRREANLKAFLDAWEAFMVKVHK